MSTSFAGELHLDAAAAERVRREIRRARGNEVCFVVEVGEGGVLLEPRVVARGHASAVLAAVPDPQPGTVVLHNHPSGVLEPSEADLAVAARLWEQGLGFAITDNDASDLYVVVEPPAVEALEPLDVAAVEGELAPGGAVARAHPGYEDRPQQRALTRMIGELYNEGGIGIAEAGTGTGKSVAYLLPAIRWALLNRERTVVSTNTINLQEQLVEKDLPFLRRALGEPFRFALVKGRSNYISIRRARLAAESAPALLESDRQAELGSIMEWLEATKDGSLSDLSFRPSAEVWEEVAVESDVCLRAKCPHFEECFYQRARREAASADVLVANHHLLFSDLAVRRAQGNCTAPAVLPHYRRLILDEAHNLEEAATRHLGASVSRRTLFRVLRRLENRGKGVLPALRRALESGRQDLLAPAPSTSSRSAWCPSWRAHASAPSPSSPTWRSCSGSARTGCCAWSRSSRTTPSGSGGSARSSTRSSATWRRCSRGWTPCASASPWTRRRAQAHEQQLLELRGASNRLEGAALALRGALRPGEEALRMVRWMELRARPARRRAQHHPRRRSAGPLAGAARDGAGEGAHRGAHLRHPRHPQRLRLPPRAPGPAGGRARARGRLPLALRLRRAGAAGHPRGPAAAHRRGRPAPPRGHGARHAGAGEDQRRRDLRALHLLPRAARGGAGDAPARHRPHLAALRAGRGAARAAGEALHRLRPRPPARHHLLLGGRRRPRPPAARAGHPQAAFQGAHGADHRGAHRGDRGTRRERLRLLHAARTPPSA